ncbi:MAG: 8-amino-7-oxononanoate synthase [Polyangiales bacterium]
MSKRTADLLAEEALARATQAGTLRSLRTAEGPVTARMRLDGREVLMLSSGNYLDLAHHEAVIEAAISASREIGCAASGSRLINGNHACHEALEAELARFFGTEAALVWSTGYMANVGVIPALVGEGDVILSDELVHASVIDGARLSRAEVRVFPHGDASALQGAFEQIRGHARRVLVVVDGVYSMDGDLAPLPQIAAITTRHEGMLLLDDSHGTGTLGARGRGSAELLGAQQGVDVLLGTLGKALGSFGAFVVCSAKVRDLLINTARSLIFSCALAPAQVEAARAALRLVEQEPWRRERLQENAAHLRARLAAVGISTAPSVTHIVPIVLGDNARTMTVCEALLERGFHAQGIRHPSVPQGTARLRVTPMATHTPADLDAFVDALLETLAATD